MKNLFQFKTVASPSGLGIFLVLILNCVSIVSIWTVFSIESIARSRIEKNAESQALSVMQTSQGSDSTAKLRYEDLSKKMDTFLDKTRQLREQQLTDVENIRLNHDFLKDFILSYPTTRPSTLPTLIETVDMGK